MKPTQMGPADKAGPLMKVSFISWVQWSTAVIFWSKRVFFAHDTGVIIYHPERNHF
jgi:hypothetical protein